MATPQKRDIDLEITRFEYGDPNKVQHAVLQIETSKYYNGGLISDASVYWVGNRSRQSCMAFGGDGGDYSKRLKISEKTMKATQKNIDKQHSEVFTEQVLGQLVESAKNHYARYVVAGIDGFKNTYKPALSCNRAPE